MRMEQQPDIDPQETQEWLDALDSVIANAGDRIGDKREAVSAASLGAVAG